MQRYRTAVPLGTGSFAEVYRCFDTQLRRTVALKVLRWNEPQSVERMFREARAQARVDHEGVCKVYDTGWRDGRPFIAMQFVDGEDLLTATRELSLRTRLRLMTKVVEAVHAAHERGLVHRDLKPDNILVHRTADGRLRPVVVDFGLVYDLGAAAGRITRNGEPLGTPAFMSPEQAGGRLEEIDVRTDVYGLGATLYALLTGSPPFDGDGTTDLLIKALESEPVAPRERLPSLPVEVDQIVLKCLEKERSRRYSSAKELADDLRRFLDGDPVRASRSGWWYPIRKRARKYRRGLAVGGAIAGVSIMALWTVDQQAREASRRAEHEQRFLQISNDLDWAFRAAQMSSIHDMTPCRKRIRRRIRELELELDRLEDVGRGPAHYAIGRAYATLHEDDSARRHLESAWQLGHRPPEVGYFLGLVIGRQYEDALERARHVQEPELRSVYLDDVMIRYRSPAKTYLEAGREAEAVSVEYVEALIDFYEERYERALTRLAEVRRSLPWLYEASLAEGKVYRRMAEKNFAESKVERALELYRRAEQSYRRALASASSDPQIYPELCHLISLRIESELDWSIPPTDQALDEHLELCDRGLVVDPLSSRAHRASALAYELGARVAVDRSWNPERARELLGRAENLAMEGVRLHPEEPDTHVTLADILMTRGRLAKVIGDPEDPLDTYRSAGESLREALLRADGPKDFLRVKIAGNHRLIARGLSERWQPADGHYEQAVELIREEIGHTPRSFTLQCDLGYAELSLAFELRWQGRAYKTLLTQAERSFRRCSDLNEKYHWAYIGLAEVLNAKATAECEEGRYDRSGSEQARDLVHQVMVLDPGFTGGLARQASFWITDAHCRIMAGHSPTSALQAIEGLADRMEAQGQDPSFFRELAGTLDLRRGLTQKTQQGSGDAGLGKRLSSLRASEINPDEVSTFSGRLYRIDQLLWMAEASWQLGRSGRDLIAETQGHLSALETVRDGELAGFAQVKTLTAIHSLLKARDQRGRISLIELDACENQLRDLLSSQPWMAPHVRPWLRRLDILRRDLA